MSKEEWIRRCAARMAMVAGVDSEFALGMAAECHTWTEGGDFIDDPEGAADEEMSYWGD